MMFKDKKGLKGIKITAFLLCMALFLTACGDVTEEIPELLEPVSTNEAYRPVEIGDIGKNTIKTGYVVPTDYSYFYTTSVTLKETYVNVGDYVEAGDILAEADSDEAESTIEELKQSLSDKKETQSINDSIFEEQQKEYDYKIKACEEAGDEEGAASYRTEKAVAAENNRYNTMLFEYQLEKINEQIEEQEELRSDATLVADHSGYVTYVKSVVSSDGSDTSQASSGDNIVIISDYDDLYIELTGESVTKNGYSSYSSMYTVINGERYYIEEYSYTNQELAMAQSYGSLPYARFNISGGDNDVLTVGTSIPLYFSTAIISDVLIVGNDSLYQEGEEYFVYVKTESSDKDKRYIETGESDDNYTEVVSGLSEGELVYYESEAIVPGNYTTYTVSLGDYEETAYISNKNYSMEDKEQIVYSAPTSGYFETFDLKTGQEVKAGDLLFTIDSGGGSAKLLEINTEITSAGESYTSQIEDYNDQIADLRQQISDYKSGNVATSTDAEPVNTLYMEEQLLCEIEIVKYNKQLAKLDYESTVRSLKAERDELNENNDGNGNISVYAESDGVVISIYASTGYELAEGEKIVCIGSDEEQIMLLNPVPESTDGNSSETVTLTLGQEVTLINQSTNETHTARVIGSTGDSGKVYITTRDGEVYISKTSTASDVNYYLSVDDESFYEEPDGYRIECTTVFYKDIITIPKALIYDETDKSTGKSYNYVWKIVDDEMVKQYVTVGGGDSTMKVRCILSGLSDGDVLAKEMTD